jgi:hypothetical protein
MFRVRSAETLDAFHPVLEPNAFGRVSRVATSRTLSSETSVMLLAQRQQFLNFG